ncbi:MAG: hypothetical protein IPM29_04710 [Planctomycetes bacterium]|nr:hypothetical protein [Planctomycetota bacterium]
MSGGTGDGASHAFLGEEFLTWLWFRTETEGGEFELGAGRVAAVSFDDLLEFAPLDDDETEHTLRKGMPTRSVEARAALRTGHRLRRARLVVAHGQLVWQLVLDGASMQPRSVRLPEDDEEAESMEERSRERAANFLLLNELLGLLYREFLRIRLRPDYLGSDAERQARWMASEG